MSKLPLYRNLTIDLLFKSIDWFLYDGKSIDWFLYDGNFGT